MELIALDKEFQKVDIISPTNIQWNSRYYSFGDFSISLPKKQYKNEMKYIYVKDREETGIINKVEYSYSETGERVQLSGFFIEKILDEKVSYPTFNGSGEIVSVLTKFVNEYKEDLPVHIASSKYFGENIEFQETGSEIGTKLFEVLQTQEMSYKLIYNFEENKMNLHFYKGFDRTQSQNKNNFITFSTKWNNLTDINANIDDSTFKNYAIIGGSGDGKERIYAFLDLSSGERKKKIFIDAKDVSYDPSKQTLDQYKLELLQKGLEKMLEHKKIENFTFKPRGKSYQYLVDYNKGDKCDIILEDIGIEIEARIINVFEVFKQNEETVELELGNQIIKRSGVK